MADERSAPENPEDGVKAAKDGARAITSYAEAIEDLFGSLVPDDGALAIVDMQGNEYRSSDTLPARAQLRLVRELKRAVGDQETVLDGIGKGNVGAAADGLVALAENLEALEALERAFHRAHATVHADAVLAAREAGLLPGEYDDVPDAEVPAGEVFPIEEIVAGLLPFLGRLVSRVAGLVGQRARAAASQR